MATLIPHLDKLVQELLDGDESRIPELFRDEIVFNELVAQGTNADWHHFEPKSFDGEYFIKTTRGYSCYFQEHGVSSFSDDFANIHDAALYFFRHFPHP